MTSLPTKMLEEHGCRDNPIWLIGDSNPRDEKGVRYPLDPRHPTRHSIWTPILDVIQETVYPLRLNARGNESGEGALYVRNAVQKPSHRLQVDKVTEQLIELRSLANLHRPVLVITFGRFAFHMCQRALESTVREVDAATLNKWHATTVEMLRQEFSTRVMDDRRTIVPLLHQIVARSFNYAHDNFNNDPNNKNYFVYTGTEIGRRLLAYHLNNSIWRLS
jgi:hypothetical protein